MRKITPRVFFGNLQFIAPEDLRYCTWGRPAVAQGYPVFTPDELTNEPLKWLKYVLLGQLGLRALDELTTEIRRFSIHDWAAAQAECVQILQRAERKQQEILVVIKLVPMDRAGQLPNFRVRSLAEVEETFKKAMAASRPGYRDKQIWLCDSITEIGKLNLAGRMSLPSFGSSDSSMLEAVWYTSPRLLENVGLPDFAYPYIRACRPFGAYAYQIEELYIPEKFRGKLSEASLLSEYDWLIRQITAYRERIEALEASVAVAGAKELSLEFKADNGYFRFIDWDTEVEISGWVK